MRRIPGSKSILMLAMAMFVGGMTLMAADFLPLAPGNQWIYQDAATGQTFTVQVGVTQYMFNDRVYFVLRGYTPRPVMVRVNEYGNIVSWDAEREAEVMLTSFEIVPGGWFEAHERACPEMGQPQEGRVTHTGPAGTWNALEIKYMSFACADAGDLSEQFAENIGMVQRVENTIAGPRTFNLVQATVGSQLIAAGQPGAFIVSALQGPQPNTWTATMRIHQTQSSPLKLHFATAQEFEARLRDPEGNVVWTWSADQMFAQAEHEIPLSSRWSETILVPFPTIPEGAARLYTLEAWITSAEGDPHFAAATTLYVPEGANGGAPSNP